MIEFYSDPAVITRIDGQALWMNEAARIFLDIPDGLALEFLHASQFYINQSDRQRVLRHMEENGFTSPIVFPIKTFTGNLYAVKALGRFVYIGYPSYFKILSSYRRIEVPEW